MLHPGNQLLGATWHLLAHAYGSAGAPAEAVRCLRVALAAAEAAYPPGSTAVAFLQRELALGLRLAAARGAGAAEKASLAEAKGLLASAASTLHLHFGPDAGALPELAAAAGGSAALGLDRLSVT